MSEQDTTNTPQVGPTAQQLTHIQSNRHQTPLSSQQPLGNQSSKRVDMKEARHWLNVLGVFLIPLMIGVYTIAYNMQQSKINQQQYDNSVKAAKESHQADIALQTDQQQETTLTSYIQNMKDSLFIEGLQKSKPDDGVRAIARAQTQTTLRRLDGARKGLVVQFLRDARLITKNDAIIDLSNADLSSAHLSGADLTDTGLIGTNLDHADLSSAHLSGADLTGATLTHAHLRGTDLSSATLTSAHLDHADLREATLTGAHLDHAHLTGTDLFGATLTDAHLDHATLFGAHLAGATLTTADLRGADLRTTGITQQQVNQAFTCKDTITDSYITHSQHVCN